MADETQRTVLVVEDDPILKNLLGNTFSGRYKAMYAGTGKEALQYVEEYKPDIILLDLMLPEMGGFEVLEQLRARTDELKDTPVIVVSNLSQESDQEKAKQLGANDYMVKAEVAIEEITSKIDQFFQEA
tara:strand:- start:1308 stop:1694 length:387 start_codon:yes stop_codon:yes gene_type:complete